MGRGLDSLRSRILSAAGAVVFAAAPSHTPARAADLGGDCCADLEERVAELEATTVRKGNKKVSVTLYGQINKDVMFWDDGAETNTYTVDNNYESSRFGLKGSAKISGDWTAGYRLEIEMTEATSQKLNQFDDNNANDPLGAFNVRHDFVYVNNKKLGEVRLGLTATPIYNITKDTNVSDLEDTMHSDNRMMQGFYLRSTGFNNAEGLSGFGPDASSANKSQKLRWQDISHCYDSSNAFVCSTRKNGVAYWTPNWEGFSASVGYFTDSEWGAALRYKKEWGEAFEVGAGVGYSDIRDERFETGGGGLADGPSPVPGNLGRFTNFQRDVQDWAGSASIKHKPTGLFVFSAFSFSETNDTNTQHAGVFTHTSDPGMSGWDVQGGIQRKMPWFGLDSFGDTSFWGGYSDIRNGLGAVSLGGPNGAAGSNFGHIPADRYLGVGTFANVDVPVEVTGADVNRWSLALDQALDKSGMHLYAVYQHLTPNVTLVDQDLNHVAAPLDDFDVFYTGARIYF
jgi:predicted porin